MRTIYEEGQIYRVQKPRTFK